MPLGGRGFVARLICMPCINRQTARFFNGKLPDVVLKVEDLSDKNAEGVTYKESEDTFVIVLDPQWNTSEDEALDTMRHESCHVATWGEEPDGPRFQECMKRFGQRK